MPAMMLGVAQAALTDTIEFARARTMSIGGEPRTRMPGNQFAVADAAMAIETGRAFLHQEARAIMARAAAGEKFTPTDAVRIEMAALVARENAQRAVDRLFSIRGAHGLFESGNFERYYRDVRIGTLHAASTPDLVRELVGKHMFGVPADVRPRWG
jgi:alkylation response protein AidB-like acyl-CoA dehydrogenase